MTISITFRALTPKRFRLAEGALIHDVSDHMSDFLTDIMEEVREYPPVPINSTYERTYLLFDSWFVSKPRWTGSGLFSTLANSAPYAAFVQGDFQTHVHQSHGWTKARNLIRERRGAYRAGIQNIVSMHLGR